MDAVRIFADARGFREEANRARKLARKTSGRLQSELYQIAVLYEKIADGNDPDRRPPIVGSAPPKMKELVRFSAAWRSE